MITVTIAGIDRTELIESLSFTDTINSRVDTLEFTTVKTSTAGFVPELGSEIVVSRGATKLFGGVVITVSDEDDGPGAITYEVSCVDYSFYLNRNLVTRRYEGQTIDHIIADLVADFAPTFTTNNVSGSIIINSIAFNRITLSECFRKLSELVNYHWYVDYNRDVHFIPANAEPAPFKAVSGNYISGSLSVSKDLSQIRNRVLVQGGEITDEERTVRHPGDGETTEFDTIYKFATLPTVIVDGVAQTVGTEYLDLDTDFDCLWNFNQKYVRFPTTNTPASPSTGTTNITITGEPLLPILVNIPDPISIEEFGEFEFAITDTAIKTRDQAIERAFAELRAYGHSLAEGEFRTYKHGLHSGQVIRVTDALRDINEDFVIQEVNFQHIAPDETYDGIYSVRLATLKTVGIITILQKLLLNEDLTQDEQILLLTFLQLSDTLGVSDTMNAVTTTTGPYYYGTATYGFATYSAEDAL